MGYTDTDKLAINTIRVLAVSLLPLPTKNGGPRPHHGWVTMPELGQCCAHHRTAAARPLELVDRVAH